MFFIELVILTSLIFLSAASIVDLRTGEIPEKISLGYGAAILALAAVAAVSNREPAYFLEPLVLGFIYFCVGYLIYRLGQWGGGDVKVLGGVGLALGLLNRIGFSWENTSFLPYTVTYFVDIAFVSMPYVLVYSFYLTAKKPAVAPRFLKSLSNPLIVVALLLSFLPSIVLSQAGLDETALVFVFVPAFFLVSLYLKAVEYVALKKTINVSELRLWDVLAEDLTVDGKRIVGRGNINGIDEKQLEEIRRLAREGEIGDKIGIRWGIRFAPILLFSFILSLRYGNLLEAIFLNLTIM